MCRRGLPGNSAAYLGLSGFHSLPLLLTSELGPSSVDSWVGGFVYVLGPCGSLQGTLLWGWAFLLPPQPLQVFFSQRFWGFISPHWNPGLHSLSSSSVVPLSSSAHKFWATHSASLCLTHPNLPVATLLRVLSTLAAHLCPNYWSGCFFFSSLVAELPYSFSGSSGYFLFLSLLLSFFWLWEEAKFIYLCLHLGQKSQLYIFNYLSFILLFIHILGYNC